VNEAGAGRFRSGVAAEEAWTLHGTESLDVRIYTNESYTKCQGLLGGNPGGRAFYRVKHGTDIDACLAAGKIPQSLEEVSGEEVRTYWKGTAIRLDGGSVWATNLPNFAGYGDPLDRDPALVRRDLSEGKMTVLEAFRVYAVVAGEDGTVDDERTLAERAARRRQRLDGEPATGAVLRTVDALDGSKRVVINDNLSLVRTAGGARYVCGCGQDLGPGEANFKDSCSVKESPVDSIGPGYTSFATDVMLQMCFREFFCPSCGARLATEVTRVTDGYLWDIELRL
jgi:N-methylhydantoinase B